jgi:hypothetical protein
MGLFESFKRTFNIGGCGIEIRPDVSTFHQGDRLAGSVLLRGGGYVQEARQLRIALVEFWTESRGSGKSRRTVTVTKDADSAILASPCTVAVGAECEYAFHLALPADARLSTPGKSTGWRLRVELDVPGAVDPSGTLDLAVEPAVALLELVRLWGEVLRWSEVLGKRSWDRHSRTTCFRLTPPAELTSEFDHLDLACKPLPGGDWQAALEFDLQEKSLMDRLKAIIDFDKAERSMRIPAAALSGDVAARNACAAELVRLMQGIVDERTKR